MRHKTNILLGEDEQLQANYWKQRFESTNVYAQEMKTEIGGLLQNLQEISQRIENDDQKNSNYSTIDRQSIHQLKSLSTSLDYKLESGPTPRGVNINSNSGVIETLPISH